MKKIRRALAASAGICSAVALGISLESGHPASALGPPPDGAYSFNEAGVSGVSLCRDGPCRAPTVRWQIDCSSHGEKPMGA
jgi:hypothetical protein